MFLLQNFDDKWRLKTVINKIQSKVIAVTEVTDSAYVLCLERKGLDFKAGQYVVINFPGERLAREYSIYSSETDPFIELLIKVTIPGDLSHRLKRLTEGTLLEISGPFGFFVLKDQIVQTHQPVMFIATGTGISPFRSFILSNPSLDYTLLHGIRDVSEAYHKDDYSTDRYIPCLSQQTDGGFKGRVTDYLLQNSVNKKAIYYLCGNSAMINDATDILEEKGLTLDQIKTEIFF